MNSRERYGLDPFGTANRQTLCTFLFSFQLPLNIPINLCSYAIDIHPLSPARYDFDFVPPKKETEETKRNDKKNYKCYVLCLMLYYTISKSPISSYSPITILRTSTHRHLLLLSISPKRNQIQSLSTYVCWTHYTMSMKYPIL